MTKKPKKTAPSAASRKAATKRPAAALTDGNAERIANALEPYNWLHPARSKILFDPKSHILYRGNYRLREIALTIDDGPHDITGDEILDLLKRENVRATFFIVAKEIEGWPQLANEPRQEATVGAIGDHTYDHIDLIGATRTATGLTARAELDTYPICISTPTSRSRPSRSLATTSTASGTTPSRPQKPTRRHRPISSRVLGPQGRGQIARQPAPPRAAHAAWLCRV